MSVEEEVKLRGCVLQRGESIQTDEGHSQHFPFMSLTRRESLS